MSEISRAASLPVVLFERHVKPFLTPYYFAVASVLGGITAVFVVVTVLLIIVVANCNVLGWVE
jgi:hypothetical protein